MTKPTTRLQTSITQWRDSLVNLSGTNRLLNYRPTKVSTLEITGPDSATLLRAIASGREMKVRGTRPDPGETKSLDLAAASGVLDGEDDQALVSLSKELPALAMDVLTANKTQRDVDRCLKNLATAATREYLDRGIWILYMAFGTISWSDDGGDKRRSPLILVPVQLRSNGPREPHTLVKSDEDMVVNPALSLKFSQYDITLPSTQEIESALDSGGLAAALDLIRGLIGKPKWVVDDQGILATFMFAKEAMYRDLLENQERILSHTVIGALGGVAPDRDQHLTFEDIDTDEIDTIAPPELTPLILDADSSQRAAVAAALAGRSFVLDGPPGTGKSQTIANMIGALLENGKTVLFVSEKAVALDVVKERLLNRGLGDFILELHSQKAVRKQVAARLGEALHGIPVAPPEMPKIRTMRVRRLRDQLSEYAAAMNEVREHLDMSVHQAIGVVERTTALPATPKLDLQVQQLDTARLSDVREQAKILSEHWDPALAGKTALWWGLANEEAIDHALYVATSRLRDLQEATSSLEDVAAIFALHRPSDAFALADLLQQWSDRPPQTPDEWLTTLQADAPEAALRVLQDDVNALVAARQGCLRVAGEHWANLSELAPINHRDLSPEAHEYVGRTERVTADHARMHAQSALAAAEVLAGVTRSFDSLSAALAMKGIGDPQSARRLLSVADAIHTPHRPQPDWLDAERLAAANLAAQTLKAAHFSRAEAVRIAATHFLPSALQIDVRQLSDRFAGYGAFSVFNKTFRADRAALRSIGVPDTSWKTLRDNLPTAVTWADAEAGLADAQRNLANRVPAYYREDATDWSALDQALVHARSIVDCLAFISDPEVVRSLVGSAPQQAALLGLSEELRGRLSAWEAIFAQRSGRPPLQLNFRPFAEAEHWLREVSAELTPVSESLYALDRALQRFNAWADLPSIDNAYDLVVAATATYSSHEPDIKANLGSAYGGESTDFAAVRDALRWVANTRDLVTKLSGSQTRRAQPLSKEQLRALTDAPSIAGLRQVAEEWTDARDQVLLRFDDYRRPTLSGEFEDYSSATALLAEFTQNTKGRNEWFIYQGARQRLDDLGFSPIVAFATAERMQAPDLPKLLEKAFFTTWIGFQLKKDSRLSPGESSQRDGLVAEYRELDDELRESAAAMIINAANSRRPRSNMGQASVITREAEKKIKHIAVRRLIDEARDVIQIIQPCFMMSPLAVSQYLPPDIQFDVVIFDEASQVSPGDAINCTYRGRALITAGDQRQLPPSSFFSVSEDRDESEDAEDDFSADYESVLDLMKSSGNFNALTLRWHYRSRHEHLITYSNASFYKGRLITFPSAQNVSEELGVKFHKVPGIYQRAGGSNNPIEAAAVAQRVFQHFRSRPDLSCGVVTFSTAQRDAVERALDDLRLADASMEKFFGDNRVDGFFIKSLESVQGDERDVIIFSIGYGPTESGQIYKNFGALNRAGGERRLNVAITRARYLVEIVSSMTSGEMGDVQNEGARHLRRYLDFAERGPAALDLELGSAGLPTESPFEDSVLDVLTEWGYQVQPQVGVAGYRIDLGIVHPNHPGVFMLGIECDGAMYHSSRSARDRDRLRHEVLVGLGWEIYHIWGTSWYRNLEAEKEKLMAALEAAVLSPIEGRLASRVGGRRTVAAILPEKVRADFAQPAEWVQPYLVAKVSSVNRYLDLSDETSAWAIKPTVLEIVAAEGPIHFDLLAQRFKEHWGHGRTGRLIKATLERAVRLAKVDRDGPFLSLPETDLTFVRTPTETCNRPIDHVSNRELGFAIESTVIDSMGISKTELVDAICRLFSWQRRAETMDRISRLIDEMVDGGFLLTDGVRITPCPVTN